MEDLNFEFIGFDWDGTLVDSLPMWKKIFDQVFADFGYQLTDEHIGKAFWEGESAWSFVDEKLISEIHQQLVIRMKVSKPIFSFNHGVLEVLNHLTSRGAKLGIISNSYTDIIAPTLEKAGIEKMFNLIVGAEQVAHHKPDPQPLQTALTKFLCPNPQQMLFIGDTITDIQAGINAGVRTGLFYPASNHRWYKAENVQAVMADYLFTEFKQLLDF